MDFVTAFDPNSGRMIEAEYKRQARNIELIASGKHRQRGWLWAAMGSVLTNNYAEGYPGKRYYGGCECVDEGEEPPCHPPRVPAVRAKYAERAAALRRAGEHGGLSGAVQAG